MNLGNRLRRKITNIYLPEMGPGDRLMDLGKPGQVIGCLERLDGEYMDPQKAAHAWVSGEQFRLRVGKGQAARLVTISDLPQLLEEFCFMAIVDAALVTLVIIWK